MKDISAFPIVIDLGDGVQYQKGMTLRDYFAAKSMQGILADPSTPEIMDIAGAAYETADAMMEARNGSQ